MPDDARLPALGLAEIEAAADRISGRIRRTPCLRSRFVSEPLREGPTMLKLECLQVTGAFKVRGATNAIMQLDDGALAEGVVTASGGNHGIGVAYAANMSGAHATVFLPEGAPDDKATRIRAWGAEVVVAGASWDEAEQMALAHAEKTRTTYIHPFADPAVIAGQGTIGRELLKQSPDIDEIVVAVGGGGLLAGVALAAKAIKPGIRVLGVEPEGAPTLKRSLDQGALTALDRLDTAAGSLAAKQSTALNFGIVQDLVDDIVLVSDKDMQKAAQWLWFEFGQAVELAGAAAVSAIQTGKINESEDKILCAIVSGGGTAGV